MASPRSRYVQIDFSLWIPIVVALVGVTAYWAVTGKRPDRTPWGRNVHLPSIAFLLISFCVYLFLQLRISYWVYRVLSPLLAIDYPYRMLAFITPIGVILVIAIADGYLPHIPHIIGSQGSGGPLVAIAGRSLATDLDLGCAQVSVYSGRSVPRYVFCGHFRIISIIETFQGIFTFNGILYEEYLPKVYDSKGNELYDDGPLYHQLHARQYGAASLSDVPCTVTVPAESPLESLELTFGVTCRGPTRFALPVTYNAYSSVFVQGKGAKLRQIPYYHLATDPRMIIDVPN